MVEFGKVVNRTLSQQTAERVIAEVLEQHGVPSVVDNQPIGRVVLLALCGVSGDPEEELPEFISVHLGE